MKTGKTSTLKVVSINETTCLLNFWDASPTKGMENVIPDFSLLGVTTRVNEHVALSGSSKSEIKTHIKNCPVCHNKMFDSNNFEVLKKCSNAYDTKISEALLIRKFRPKLNKQLLTKGTSYVLKVF